MYHRPEIQRLVGQPPVAVVMFLNLELRCKMFNEFVKVAYGRTSNTKLRLASNS
jgi:hypothetical protein